MSGLLKAAASGLLLLALSATLSAQEAPPQVPAPVPLQVVQDHRLAPFAFRDQQGNAQGLIIDIWRLIAAKQQVPLQVELMDWPDTISRVQNTPGLIHGGLLLSPERRKTLAFSAPLFELRTAIFIHTKKLAGAIDIGDLQAMPLGVVAGAYEQEYLLSHYETQPLKLYQNSELLVQAAIAGEVDAFVADYPVGMYYLDRYTTPDKFRVLTVLYRRSLHAAVARDNTALLAKINTAIGAISAEEMTALQQKWVNHKEVRVFNWSALLLVALVLIALTAAGLLLQTRSLNRKVSRQRAQLREHEQQMALLTDNMTDWVWKIDARNRYSYLSPSVHKLLGYQPQELLGQPMEVVLHASERERALAEFQHVMRNAKRYGTTGVRDSVARYGLQHKNGELVWTEAAVRMFFNAEGEFAGAQGSSRDIRERKEAEDIIRQSVSTDALTRLPNRRQLNEQLQKAMAACGRHHQYAALVFIDIDNFRYINDNYGHDQGDLLLQEIAQRLLTHLRPGDSLARFGGDEFVLVVEQLGQDAGTAERLAQEFGEQLLALFTRDFVLINQRCKVSTSIGIALFNGEERSASTLLKFADSAMNQAKAAGRNRCVIHSTHTKG
ncbi:sensory box protein [Cellvibrio sp. BR]|uniref:diguanylate cyclase domain-containing protein n=1 Tax=Cellvibrio sp. BR TaxID=1134474 RepID=UPI0002601539|nr:diguanylate cyclase [Cellvibrio sp. BR]EIK46238.1 sensory box protein [Cellvibrio sp. BR]